MKNPPLDPTRREFIRRTTATTAGLSLFGLAACSRAEPTSDQLFRISLAEWSLNRAIFGGEMDHLDFAVRARQDFGIEAVEYVNQMFFERATDRTYLSEMRMRADDHGVHSLLIMVDREGNLGESDESRRARAVDNHRKWVDAAQFLGCHAIRVNAGGDGSREEVAAAAAQSLGELAAFAAPAGISVLVENHGGYSSDARWLSGVISDVGQVNCGTLPDFGNFCIAHQATSDGSRECVEEYDRYRGVEELMPFAQAVSAKSYAFDAQGNETTIDYPRIMRLVTAAGYNGFVGIEYEGHGLSEEDGIRRTQALLERVRADLS